MAKTARNWVENSETNVCMVDWKSESGNLLTSFTYSYVAMHSTAKVASVVTFFLKYLISCHSVDIEKVSIAGHSLGAHIGMLCRARLKVPRLMYFEGADLKNVKAFD